MRLRFAVSFLALGATLGAVPLIAQTRAIDEGTLTITKPGAPSATENFRILRRDDGQITAKGTSISGGQQTQSTLVADSTGTPLKYDATVRDRSATILTIAAQARPGRLASLSTTQAGDESVKEYPMQAGKSLLLDSGLFHQLYFVALGKREAAFQVIDPRSPRATNATLTAKGLEPVEVGGKSVTGTHYTLVSGAVRSEFWVDAQGRLLRAEIPSQGLVVTREDAPR